MEEKEVLLKMKKQILSSLENFEEFPNEEIERLVNILIKLDYLLKK